MLTMLLPGKKSTLISLGSVLLTGVLAASVFTAVPAVAADFPSWDQIEQAKRGIGDKAARIAELEALFDDLSAEAGSRGTAAVQAFANQQRAEDEVQATSRAVDVIAAQRAEAASAASELSHQMGALAAETYKTGGINSSLLMLLDADAAVGALDRLTTLHGISDRTDSLSSQAAAAENILASLEEREAAALQVREESAAQFQRLAAQAQEAAAIADTAVREARERSAVLVEQLAHLRETSVQLETERLQGLQAAESYREQQAAREAEMAARNTEQQQNAGAGAGAGFTTPPTGGGTKPVINPTVPPQIPAPNPVAPVTPVPPAPTAPAAPSPVLPPVPTPEPAPEPVPVPPSEPVDDPAGAQAYASGRLGAYGWSQDQFRCLVNLWQRESGWRTSANNPYSGAYGIPQSLPGHKMASAGSDWRTSYRTQIEWGLGYIRSTYGNPCGAWQHSEEKNWY